MPIANRFALASAAAISLLHTGRRALQIPRIIGLKILQRFPKRRRERLGLHHELAFRTCVLQQTAAPKPPARRGRLRNVGGRDGCAPIGRIDYLEAAEATKIFVNGTQCCAVLEGECSQRGVRHERTCDLGFTHLML